ncbi:putative gibberellin regulated protein [Helianthus annuus]|uniref:Gibberellin regulated protein n=1 Tax=Helianthus annuus TaxID=4232 RepID=A0A9K3GTE9_HELAN|nr:putative gibberellin regulated protein [Helianthus annuus]
MAVGCFSSCGLRCELHSNQDRCHRDCMACCNRCNCVPPGQYGKKEICGSCYTDMKTQAVPFLGRVDEVDTRKSRKDIMKRTFAICEFLGDKVCSNFSWSMMTL